MTTVDRNWLLLGVCFLALTFVAATFAGMAPFTDSSLVFPMIILIEVIVYFIAAMVTNPRATLGMAAGCAIILVMLRALCCFAGGVLYDVFTEPVAPSTFIYTWVNPVVLIVQIVVLMFAGPYILAIMLPNLVGAQQAAKLRGDVARKSEVAQKSSSLETNPQGGFIQVFSFEELGAVIKKSHGIEGFILVSSEGLVVWKDFPLRVSQDVLVAKLLGYNQGLGAVVEETGLTKVRRLMIESRDHFICATTLDQNFSLILFFSGRVAPEEILSRIAVLSKSCREFLQWKYPSLPLKAGAPKDVSLELA